MLKLWHLKALLQKSFSLLPGGHRLNTLMQKYVTRGLDLNDQHLHYKLTHAGDHYRHFRQSGKLDRPEGLAQFSLLELGTGWYPIVPVCFFLIGFGRILSYDINSWLTKDSLRECIRRLLAAVDSGSLFDYLPEPAIDDRRLATLRRLHADWDRTAFAEILQTLHFQARVADVSELDLAADSVDFICSNNTFEHIYPAPLERILAQLQRVLVPGGTMSHFIDMSDHFSHLDASISSLNFLRFSRRAWARIDNSIQPQNRLRLSDFRRAYARLGIAVTEEVIVTRDEAALARTPVHAEFAAYDRADLATLHAYLISGKEEA